MFICRKGKERSVYAGLAGEAKPASAGRRRGISGGLKSAFAIWLAVIGVAMVEVIGYSNSPSEPGMPPASWPAQSQISLEAAQPVLVMFAHPRCPCTRASLGELELLMARASGRLRAHVLFFKPGDAAADWEKTALWRHASAIPGVTVHRDNAGTEARRFGVATSGHTLLYDRSGRLQFQGGITLSRGHAGNNPGRTALLALAHGEASSQATTPVFGCSLVGAECQEREVECKR
jgi:hypothetical protein